VPILVLCVLFVFVFVVFVIIVVGVSRRYCIARVGDEDKALSARRHCTGTELDEATVSTVPDAADDPEVTLQKKNRAEALRQSLRRLSPEHREVIDLAYYHGKSVKEIAEIVSISEATVKTRMFRARRKLAELGRDDVVGAHSWLMIHFNHLILSLVLW